ncbi:50S ribosomal protein L29 [Legionella geestiana]|uniref:Large ribosomal subunit protein uL29 n=1 Tax=Legionella geestiana TaxID=45065 RepID=A0A0W0TU64_9GAMM|nr:50S ribosomal protein L29 [Legionella geestiana]KTC99062.1 50S ribosomal protein L29 [Legionella geestiana]QBS12608.1 50S ribosomal protein L29 [Legionella geestiana]STX54935.1 50S ribosomal protein L29 [Legionella geestiana]
MKTAEQLRELSLDSLNGELLTLRKEQMGLRFKHSSGSLEKPHLIKSVRRSIARVKTIIGEKAGNTND